MDRPLVNVIIPAYNSVFLKGGSNPWWAASLLSKITGENKYGEMVVWLDAIHRAAGE